MYSLLFSTILATLFGKKLLTGHDRALSLQQVYCLLLQNKNSLALIPDPLYFITLRGVTNIFGNRPRLEQLFLRSELFVRMSEQGSESPEAYSPGRGLFGGAQLRQQQEEVPDASLRVTAFRLVFLSNHPFLVMVDLSKEQ